MLATIKLNGKPPQQISKFEPKWAQPPLTLPPYLPEDAAASRGGGSVEQALEWAEVRAAANEALKTVLSAPFHVFWSYVLHDATLMPFVDSFLRFAPRRLRLSGDDGDGASDGASDGDGDGDDGDDDAAATDADEAELRRRVLLVLLRVATPRPSADECFAAQRWAALVYDHWVLDAPKLIDACALYAFDRAAPCARLLSAALELQPKYHDDLAQALGAAATALAGVCGVGGDGGLPLPSVHEAAGAQLGQLCAWVADCGNSLHATLAAAPQLARTVAGRVSGDGGLLTAAQLAVEIALPALRGRLPSLPPADARAARRDLDAAGYHLLHAAARLLRGALIEPAAAGGSGDALLAALRQLRDPCEVLADALPAYVSAEMPTAPAAARAAPASLACGAGCLLEQLRHICNVDAPLAALCDGTALGAAHRREVATLVGASAGAGASSSSSSGGGGGSSDLLSAREEASVREMREIFADCGVGFLGALLRHCGGSAEAAVDLLFSERPLPAALAHVPRDTPTFPPPPPAATPAPAPAPAPVAASVDPTTAAAMAAAAKRSAKKGPAASAVRAEDASETRQALGDHGGGGGRRLLPKALAQALGEAGADEYEDEWDDSLEQLAAVGGGGMLQESADDLEEAAARRAGGRPDGGAAAGPAQRPAAADAASLPRTAMEWVAAIGLGQYADALRSAGIARLPLAARLTAADCDRAGIKGAHQQRLLAAAARLAERLQRAGKALPTDADDDPSGYARAAMIRYDDESGTWYGDDGSVDASAPAGAAAPFAPDPRAPAFVPGGGGGGGGGGGPSGAHVPAAALSRQQQLRQRQRKEQQKGQRNKAAAAKKSAKGGF